MDIFIIMLKVNTRNLGRRQITSMELKLKIKRFCLRFIRLWVSYYLPTLVCGIICLMMKIQLWKNQIMLTFQNECFIVNKKESVFYKDQSRFD